MLENFFQKPHTGAVGAFEQHRGAREGVMREMVFRLEAVGEPKDRGVGGSKGEFVADEDRLTEPARLDEVEEATVLGIGLGTQLTHAAEHDDLVVGMHVGEAAYGGLHAGGVGIVAVEQELVAGGGFELRTVVGRGVLLESLLDVEKFNLEETSDGEGGKGVGEIVAAEEVGGDVVNLVAQLGVEREAGVGAEVGGGGDCLTA